MFLDGANDKIQVVTDATADIEVSRSWAENNAGTITPGGGPLASITTATTTEVVAAAGASKQRSVREMTYYNNHASTASTVTVQRTDGTNTVNLFETVLAASESLVYNQNGSWLYYDPTGKLYTGLGPVATQAEMEAGTSLTTMVTPGRQQFHPSAVKYWVKHKPGAVNSASYNVTSVSDAAAGIAIHTIATDFSSADWNCQATIESTSDTMSVTNLKFTRIGLADQAAGTVNIESHDGTAITAVIEDPTAWHSSGLGDQA